ncbi:MAG: DegV family protein [Bacilli bacterium]|nr:DegV family protein [Bacilli bacterium]
MKIKLSADTSCLINQEVLKKNNISQFPLNVIIDGTEYLDGISINQEQLANFMNSNCEIKTSTPPPGVIIEYFESIFNEGYDKVIHFTISSKLSSMYNLFTTIANEYFENKLIIVDSYSGSALMLSHILYAKEELEKNTDINEILEEIENRKKDNFVWIIPKNLTTLKKGGRVSPAIAAVGNVLGLKPVLSFVDGELLKDGMTKSMKKAFYEKIDTNYQNYPTDKYDYVIISFDGDLNVVKFLEEHINQLSPNYKVIIGNIPINISAHCGPGTIGLLITPKINNKSINDYL